MQIASKLAAAIAILVIVAGCGGSETTAPQSGPTESQGAPAESPQAGEATGSTGQQFASGATFTMAMAADPGSLNPATAVKGSTNLFDSFVYDTLVHVNPDNEIVSGLATDWKVKPKSVTFSLDKDATCSDGSPVTAKTVAGWVSHVVDPATKSPLLGVLIPPGMTAVADQAADTVTLKAKKPSPFLLQSATVIYIACGEGASNPKALKKHPSGSGPYQLVESVPKDHYTLKARQGYTWGPGGSATSDNGVPAKVVLRVISSETTRANLLLSGEINAAFFTGPERGRVAKASGVTTQRLPAGNADLLFNQGSGHPGAHRTARKALSQAVDLGKLAKVTTQGTGHDSTGLTTLAPRPCQVDSVTGHLPSFDPAAAKQALDEAGWKVGPDGVRTKNGQDLSVKIVYNTSYGAGYEAAAQLMATAWKKIGVKTDLQARQLAQFTDALFNTGNWDVAMVPFGLSLPTQFVGLVSGPPPPKGSNIASIDNQKYSDLATKASTTAISDGGCKIWAKAESALFDDFDVIPVVEPTQLLAAKGVSNLVILGGNAQPTLFRMLQE